MPTIIGAIHGFRLLAGARAPNGAMWDIVDVTFGSRSDWRLRVELEKDGSLASIFFADPVSFRVQDERDMVDYWLARSVEAVPVGLLYAIARSPYLSEFEMSVGAAYRPLTHFLLAGYDTCVEVLAPAFPILPGELSHLPDQR